MPWRTGGLGEQKFGMLGVQGALRTAQEQAWQIGTCARGCPCRTCQPGRLQHSGSMLNPSALSVGSGEDSAEETDKGDLGQRSDVS